MSSNLKVNNILPSTGDTVAVSGIASVTSSVSIASSCTATTFYGSGANLTSLPSQVTISNNGNDRIITGGSGTNLNGEGDFTFDGTTVKVLNTIPKIELNDGGGRILQVRGGSTSHNPSIVTQYASPLYLGCNNTESVNIGTDNLTVVGGWPKINLQATQSGGENYQIAGAVQGVNNAGFCIRNTTDSVNILEVDTDSSRNLKVVSGNVVIGTSGKGIDFSATSNSAGSMTSELLDHYEEGTWTPTIYRSNNSGVSGNYNHQEGSYVRIGRLVYALFRVDIASFSGGSGHTAMGGLPFTTNNHGVGGWTYVANMSRMYLDGDFAGGVDATSIRFAGGINYGYIMNIDDDQWDYNNYTRVLFEGYVTYQTS